MTDPLSNIVCEVATSPQVLADDGSVTSNVIDTQDHDTVEFVFVSGAWDGASSVTVLIQHGEQPDLSDATTVPDSMLYGSINGAALAAEETATRIRYKASTGKRYVRAVLTASGVVTSLAPTPDVMLFSRTVSPLSTPLLTETIDTLGADYVLLTISIGATFGGDPKGWLAVVDVQHGVIANGGDGSSAPSATLDGTVANLTFGSATPQEARSIGYWPRHNSAKRYVRLRIDFSGNAQAEDYLAITVVGVAITTPASPALAAVALGEIHRSRRAT